MSDPILPDMTAPDVAEPTGEQSAPDIFPKLKGWVKGSLDHLSEWRKEAETAQEFYAGWHWSKEEQDAFESDGRIAPIFNLTAVSINAVCGLEVNNRQDVKYLPRTEGDVQVNELLSSCAMWVRDQAQAEDEESNAFKDTVITGLGVTETRKNERLISVDRRDPTECFYDKSATKTNLVDRRYGGRVIMMDTDEAVAFFTDETGQPKYTAFQINAKWASLGLGDSKEGVELLDYPTEQVGPVGNESRIPKKVCLVEIEWFDWVGTEKVYYQAFLGASEILEQNPLKEWAYNWMTGEYDAKKKRFYGLIRAFIDPQKFINKMVSVGTHILATNAKGGLIVERGVFVDQRQAEKDWSNPQKTIEVTEGSLSANKIQPRVAPPLPTGISQLLEFALNIFNRVTGLNAEVLGTADRDQPASLEMQRRQSAVTILATLFDSKRRYHKEQGKTLLQLMKRLPPETLVRITTDQPQQPPMPQVPPGMPPEQQVAMMEQYAQMVGQQQEAVKREMYVKFETIQRAFADDTIEFDVIVDEAPSSPNMQQEIIAKLNVLSQAGMQMTPQAQAIVIKNIGLPETVADELAEAVSGSNPETEQLKQQLQQGAQLLQQVQSENAQLKADQTLDVQKAQVEQFKAQTDRMNAETDRLRAQAELIASQRVDLGGVNNGYEN